MREMVNMDHELDPYHVGDAVEILRKFAAPDYDVIYHIGRARRVLTGDSLRTALSTVELALALIERERALTESAWVVIANAGGGDWTTQTQEWQDAAARWRDRWLDGADTQRARQ
jgi:hypothetical protein